jgi:uncharacterized protein
VYTYLVQYRFPPELAECTGFQWDAGNSTKNDRRHDVSNAESEQVFSNAPLLLRFAGDIEAADEGELRDLALGRTDHDRWLFVAFTQRGTLIRVISARDMNKTERKAYAKAIRQTFG